MPYPGGKAGAGIYQRIINQIPPHFTFIEAFAGDLAVLRHKFPAARNIAIEIDSQRAQDLAAEFRDPAVEIHNCDAIEWLKHFFGLYQLLPPHPPAGPTVGPAPSSNGHRRRHLLPPNPPAAAAATSSGVGRSPIFAYLDPPYIRHTRRNRRRLYAHEMTEAQHADLLRIINLIPCNIAISGYWSPLYAHALQNWRKITFTATTRGRTLAREYLWMNYPPPAELHDYRYLGNEKRERERIKRKVNIWSAGLLRLPALERQAIIAGISISCR
jgi:DNA adenine methylase